MRLLTFVIPAKAGTHLSAIAAAEPWVPAFAFAGMTTLGEVDVKNFPITRQRGAPIKSQR